MTGPASMTRHQDFSVPPGAVVPVPVAGLPLAAGAGTPGLEVTRGGVSSPGTPNPFVDGSAGSGDLTATPDGRAQLAAYLDRLEAGGYLNDPAMGPFIHRARAQIAAAEGVAA